MSKRKKNAPPRTTKVAIEPNYQERIAFLLGAISNLLAAGGGPLRKAFNLGLGEARLLYVLGYEPDLTAGRASQIMGIDKAATSRALADLERRGLVRVSVDARDGRQRAIQLTAAGIQLRDRYMAVALEREKRLLSIFSKQEVDTLSNLLQRLRGHVTTARASKAETLERRPGRSTGATGRMVKGRSARALSG
jgi:DNA-binding MarR family transcriptional regulator